PRRVVAYGNWLGLGSEDEVQQPRRIAARGIELVQHLTGAGDRHAADSDKCADQPQPAHVLLVVFGTPDLLTTASRKQVLADVVLDSGHRNACLLAQFRDPHLVRLLLADWLRCRLHALDSLLSKHWIVWYPAVGPGFGEENDDDHCLTDHAASQPSTAAGRHGSIARGGRCRDHRAVRRLSRTGGSADLAQGVEVRRLNCDLHRDDRVDARGTSRPVAVD